MNKLSNSRSIRTLVVDTLLPAFMVFYAAGALYKGFTQGAAWWVTGHHSVWFFLHRDRHRRHRPRLSIYLASPD